MSTALLIARLILGLGLAAHGAQKLFGWFGGYGPAGTGQFFESQLGFRPGVLFAVAAGLGEFLGGLLLATGLGGGFGPAIAVVVMATAILTTHLGKGFFTSNGGPELPLVYIAGALALAFAGFGGYALDSVFGWSFFNTSTDRWILIAAAIVLALVNWAIGRAGKAAAVLPEQRSAA